MVRLKYFIAPIIFAFMSCPVHSGVLWETNFDDLPNWSSAETASITIASLSPESAAIYGITGGLFDGYRSARGQLDVNGRQTYQITSDHAYGGTGKALDCWYEAAQLQVGGGLGIHLGADGYDEVYLRWRMRFDDDYRHATVGGLGGTIDKLFRIMSNVDSNQWAVKTDPMDMQRTPSTRPDWLDNCDPFNSYGECGKQGYVILRWEQIGGQMAADKIAYNPEGRAGSLNDIYYDFDNSIQINFNDYHASYSNTNPLTTSSHYPDYDYVGNGNWVTYEVHARHNTVGQSDGLFELWLNGTKVAQVSGMLTRASENTKFNYIILPDNHANKIYGLAYYPELVVEALSTPHAEQLFTIDEIVVSTTYVPDDYVIGTPSIPPAVKGAKIKGVFH